MRALYFGCLQGAYGHNQAGHYFYGPGGTRAAGIREDTFKVIPWGTRVDSRLAPTDPRGEELPQGQARVHYHPNRVTGQEKVAIEGRNWTAVSFWDRTGDSRGNSSSTFLFNRLLTFEEAIVLARHHWPELFDRFDFEVTEAPR